ncbi:MAG TPA: hypothetical protein VK507_23100 [Iamia sp.]|nr:hypothetical protein [Iamia sp.]
MSDAEPYLSVTVPASADAVWHALRDPDEIRAWFGWEYPGLEDEIAMIFHGEMSAEIELPEMLDTTIEVDDEARTLRTGPHLIQVTEVGDGAVVRVTRVIDVGSEGWEHFHPMIDHIEEGWLTFFQTLAFAIERHPREPRRTVFGAGLLPGDPLAALGLAVDAPPGARYEVTTAPGDVLTGTVRFRSARQIGLTVDAWGDGLLVAAAVPGGTDEGAPAMTIASTYGLPDDARAALEARWSAWWQTNAVTPPEEPAEG